MANIPLNKLTGSNGSTLFTAGEQTANVSQIVIQEDDTALEAIFETQVDRDPDSGTYGQRILLDVTDEQNPDSGTYKKGAILTPRRGYFAQFQFDKDVIGYNLVGPKQIDGE